MLRQVVVRATIRRSRDSAGFWGSLQRSLLPKAKEPPTTKLTEAERLRQVDENLNAEITAKLRQVSEETSPHLESLRQKAISTTSEATASVGSWVTNTAAPAAQKTFTETVSPAMKSASEAAAEATEKAVKEKIAPAAEKLATSALASAEKKMEQGSDKALLMLQRADPMAQFKRAFRGMLLLVFGAMFAYGVGTSLPGAVAQYMATKKEDDRQQQRKAEADNVIVAQKSWGGQQLWNVLGWGNAGSLPPSQPPATPSAPSSPEQSSQSWAGYTWTALTTLFKGK